MKFFFFSLVWQFFALSRLKKKVFFSAHNKRDNNGCSENCLLDLFKHENYQQREGEMKLKALV